MILCTGYRKLGCLVFLMGLAYVVGDCPLGYCTHPSASTTSESCNIEVDAICSSETYCQGNGQCFKDRGSPNVFCNCSEGMYGDSCQYTYTNTSSCSSDADCNSGNCDLNTNQCNCRPGYRGNNCENVMRFRSSNNLCANGGTAYILGDSLLCMCPCGFAGYLCKDIIQDPARKLPDQDTLPPNTTKSSGRCVNGIQSTDKYNRPICHCNCGYFGQFCEYSTRPTAPNYKNWCDDAFNYCLNGATCIVKSGGCNPICNCKSGYYGYRCNNKMAVITSPPPRNKPISVNDKDKEYMIRIVSVVASILLVAGLFGCIFFCICVLDNNCKRYLCCIKKKPNDTETSTTDTRRGNTRQNHRNNITSRPTRHTFNRPCDNTATSPTSNLVIGNQQRPLQSVIALPPGLTQINVEENQVCIYSETSLGADSTRVENDNILPSYEEVSNVKLPTYEEALNHI